MGESISEKVLKAMLRVPRHLFVPDEVADLAYTDVPLPIGSGQTISAPHIVAIMCDLLDIKEGDIILEIGAGCGYNAAVMAELTGQHGHIYSIERIPELAEIAQANLKKTGYTNVDIICADGSTGLLSHAPYKRIIVTSAAPAIPDPLIDQLSPSGTMVIPVGQNCYQQLYLVKKEEDAKISIKDHGEVIFVPLIGKYGFH